MWSLLLSVRDLLLSSGVAESPQFVTFLLCPPVCVRHAQVLADICLPRIGVLYQSLRVHGGVGTSARSFAKDTGSNWQFSSWMAAGAAKACLHGAG